MDRRVAVLTTVAIVGGIVTLVVASLDLLHRSPGAHIAIETCTTLIAVSCALLLLGRLRGWGSSEELLLMAAVAVVGLGELLYSLLPSMIGEGLGPFATWSSIVVRLAGAVLFAVAAVLADRRLASPARTARQTLALCAAGVLATGLLVLAIDPGPTAIRRGEEPFAHALIGAAQVASIALFALAAVAFGVRSLRRRDELVFCVALANVLAALAAANFLVFPSLYTSWVSVGDGFRLASALALLTGVWMEVTAYQRQLAHEAVLEERRRMARDLHDGIAQDLAFIRSQTAELAVAVPDDRRAARITGAAQRALDESRSAIAVLTRPEDEPLDATVRAVAEEIADWSDAEVLVAIDPALEVDAEVRSELIRIIREAVANAVRHGDASAVRIEARRRGGVYVRVADDGHGFDVCGAMRTGAFGLTSMRERAERLDARFRLQSAPGAGTVVEVTLP